VLCIWAGAHPAAAQHGNAAVGHHSAGDIPQAAGRTALAGDHVVQLVAHLRTYDLAL
jgi:hypothetical protein